MKDEKKIIDSVDPVSIEGTEKILNQLKNCICKIKIKDGFGTGFFCKFPFEKEVKKVFITNYHVLNEEYVKEQKKINLLLNDEKKVKIIGLENKKIIYYYEDFDITLIELQEENEIQDYLELDDNLFQDNSEIIYINKSVYVLQYPNGKKACVSYGLLNGIENYNINHKCSTDAGSSGSPILNLETNKVIGIHRGGSINFEFNKGTYLKFPLKDFINKISKEKMKKTSKIIKNIEYKIIKELNNDGYERVIKVLNESENKYYAIKEIQIDEEPKETIKSIQNEIDILSKFNSKNIIKYYDSYKDDNNIYILMELCEGGNLRNFINRYINNNTKIDENVLNNIIKQIFIGIKEIHNKKLIHKDLKPEKIFINENMDIKIGFPCISKYLKKYKNIGTNYYIAPEIYFKGIYNDKSDMWSLGCIIYELFNVKHIYFNDKLMNDVKKIDSEVYNYKWQKLIDSLLQTDCDKRFDINQAYEFLEGKLTINIHHNDSIKKIKNEKDKININNENNIIIGEIYIKKEDINKEIQIINSFENVKKEYNWEDDINDWKHENEKEIKENIEIKINGKIIKFSYYYKFNKEGRYKIEYTFKNNLTKTCFMFSCCSSLTYLNLSNFNTEKVTNMGSMFYDCSSLKNLNLSNFNTDNVTDMRGMFWNCCSLEKLSLSSFNTPKVINMREMFYECNSLKNLNLSNFNTQNVTDMNEMFYNCKSLKKENIITNDKKILTLFNKNLY